MHGADIDQEFLEFVGDAGFPCLAAKGVVRRLGHELHVYGTLASDHATNALAADLREFVRRATSDDADFRAFVAVFPDGQPEDEREFERRLWVQLQQLHERDDPAAGWDPSVSADPDDPRFSFSFAGCALFIVGLNPHSSRLARRFRWPALVFNPHAQFERLRRDGHYDRMRTLIRDREVALQGDVNPNLADFGEQSEARQYSGRDTTADEWTCPFHPHPR
ncbi:MAG TPA: guanitoxin biosynthesis heme-dependent pre-guanitoxin N-hydroxylase GntA [Gemmatimonadaceae bacterium]|nr:guanitoxin biosynthesis heme-dependent pre-guanitoxin N-hydroxylase GntA [Gemmatimonadaceae bacterium]